MALYPMHRSASTVRDVISDAVPAHTEATDSNSEGRSSQRGRSSEIFDVFNCKEHTQTNLGLSLMKYYSIINIGYYRSDITRKISLLFDKTYFRYKIYHRINELGKFNDDIHIRESRDDFIEMIVAHVKEINKSIDQYNLAAAQIFNAKKVRRVAVIPIRKEIKRLFKKHEVDQSGYNLIAPYVEKELYDFLMKTLDVVFTDLIQHKDDSENFLSSFKVREFDAIYKPDLHQLLDIYMLGYKSTAVLVLGRVFEKLFTLWGHELIIRNLINKTRDDFNDMRLENILGLFKASKLITDKDWHTLSKLRLDRNIGGHYISEKDALVRSESEEEAEATIRLALPLLKKYHNKYIKLNRLKNTAFAHSS